MRTRIRRLTDTDLARVLELLSQDPIENLFLASKVYRCGLDPFILGGQIWGFERHGQLVSICYIGGNLCVVGDDDQAIETFITRIGLNRKVSSIVGNAQVVEKLYYGLSNAYGKPWSNCREYRSNQLMLATNRPCTVATDPRVRRIRPNEFDLYFPAAVAMYTEELGASPLDGGSGYSNYIKSLINNGRAFGIVENGKVVFKSDIGSSTQLIAQIQGVWMEPEHRGKGKALAALAAVTNLCLAQYKIVSLYVNDFNHRARHLYKKLGFKQTSRYATVLY